jgi:hypothetical protein
MYTQAIYMCPCGRPIPEDQAKILHRIHTTQNVTNNVLLGHRWYRSDEA